MPLQESRDLLRIHPAGQVHMIIQPGGCETRPQPVEIRAAPRHG